MTSFLRDMDVPELSHAAAARVRQLRHDRVAAPDESRVVGRLGDALRTSGELVESERLLTDALGEARTSGDARFLAASLIRLATTLQYLERHDAALVLFDEAVDASSDLRHYALQHRGKALAELGRFQEARADFEAALALREATGDQHLITSTHGALTELAALTPDCAE